MTAIETETLLEYILVEYRWVLVVTALLPMSLVWKVWSTLRSYVVFKLNSAPRMHDRKVQEVQRQIKAWLSGDRSTRLCTARPTWQTMSFRQGLYKKTFTNIEVNLVDVLEVDKNNMICSPRISPIYQFAELSKRFQEESLKQNPHQFVEALLYNKDQGVVMLGDMVDEIGSDGKYNPIGKWYSEWFFKQVEKHLNARQSIVEYIPLRDYYHRHTKSLFWELQDIIFRQQRDLPLPVRLADAAGGVSAEADAARGGGQAV
ncbi:hypothetical protein MSG28_011636 [Choristoneura fumiferana]|uniref:Uncharacterized protein n=1 Tax=Choristoneura fumiferana TaxID=7141 RepID=A0ACC0KLT9_CHOFU|nr:hypothetical protein MSG28_011636 [Choristoneura fumiferana]